VRCQQTLHELGEVTALAKNATANGFIHLLAGL
jgi:hypothetical protein